MLSLILTALFFFASDCNAQGWNIVPTSGALPGRRTGASLVNDGSSLILFGGVDLNYSSPTPAVFHNNVHFISTTGLKWRDLTSTGPSERAYHGAFRQVTGMKDKMIIHGGSIYDIINSSYANIQVFNDTWSMDVSTAVWTQITPANGLTPGYRTSFTMTHDGSNHGWMGFGFNLNATGFHIFNDLWMYNFTVDEWVLVVPNGTAGSPPRRHSCSLTAGINHIIYLLGGRDGNISYNDVWRYNITSSTWSEMLFDPEFRIDAAYSEFNRMIVISDVFILIMGGQNGSSGNSFLISSEKKC